MPRRADGVDDIETLHCAEFGMHGMRVARQVGGQATESAKVLGQGAIEADRVGNHSRASRGKRCPRRHERAQTLITSEQHEQPIQDVFVRMAAL